MMNCWQSEPETRPSFSDLTQQLKRMENQHKVRLSSKQFKKESILFITQKKTGPTRCPLDGGPSSSREINLIHLKLVLYNLIRHLENYLKFYQLEIPQSYNRLKSVLVVVVFLFG